MMDKFINVVVIGSSSKLLHILIENGLLLNPNFSFNLFSRSSIENGELHSFLSQVDFSRPMIVLSFLGKTQPQQLHDEWVVIKPLLDILTAFPITRIFLLSSHAVYGDKSVTLNKPTDPLLGRSLYARSKIFVENQSFCLYQNLPLCILRLSNVAGVDAFISKLRKDEIDNIVIYQDGRSAYRSYISPRTLVSVLHIIFVRNIEIPSVINVSSPHSFFFSEFVEIFGQNPKHIFSDEAFSSATVNIRDLLNFMDFPSRENECKFLFSYD